MTEKKGGGELPTHLNHNPKVIMDGIFERKLEKLVSAGGATPLTTAKVAFLCPDCGEYYWNKKNEDMSYLMKKYGCGNCGSRKSLVRVLVFTSEKLEELMAKAINYQECARPALRRKWTNFLSRRGKVKNETDYVDYGRFVAKQLLEKEKEATP